MRKYLSFVLTLFVALGFNLAHAERTAHHNWIAIWLAYGAVSLPQWLTMKRVLHICGA